jgi:hypothetical protein
MQGRRLFENHVFGRPAVNNHQARLPRNHAAFRRRFKKRDAVGPRHGQQFGIGIDGDPGLHFRHELSDFLQVERGPHGFDLQQAEGVFKASKPG